jgi:hypothetical protein
MDCAWEDATTAFSTFLRRNIQFFNPEDVAENWHEMGQGRLLDHSGRIETADHRSLFFEWG